VLVNDSVSIRFGEPTGPPLELHHAWQPRLYAGVPDLGEMKSCYSVELRNDSQNANGEGNHETSGSHDADEEDEDHDEKDEDHRVVDLFSRFDDPEGLSLVELLKHCLDSEEFQQDLREFDCEIVKECHGRLNHETMQNFEFRSCDLIYIDSCRGIAGFMCLELDGADEVEDYWNCLAEEAGAAAVFPQSRRCTKFLTRVVAKEYSFR